MSRRAPGPTGPHTFRAVVIVVLAVAVTVGLLTQLHAGRPSSVAGRAGTSGSGASTTTTVAPSTTTTTAPPRPPSQVRLQVLNGLLTGTLSSQWSAKLHTQEGYVTLAPDNTTAQDPTSAIYVIKSGYEAEAAALAKTVGLPKSAIVDTVPSNAPIPGIDLQEADLVLVIGQSLASQA